MTRRGFVLVAALVALVVIALLITGVFFATGQEMTVTRNELRDQQAFEYAEYALARAVGGWDVTARESMTTGQTASLAAISNGSLQANAFVTRLDTALYLVVAESRHLAPDAVGLRRRVGILVRTVLDGAAVNPPMRVPEQPWSELY
jgi:Tfp pilus assembly protein PilX